MSQSVSGNAITRTRQNLLAVKGKWYKVLLLCIPFWIMIFYETLYFVPEEELASFLTSNANVKFKNTKLTHFREVS